MKFEDELQQNLPRDLPHRDIVIQQSAIHLERIVETNRQFNLTRVISPLDAAIKHVVDSVLPWRHFVDCSHILDAGTGAGFPGIPLALVLPETSFTLAESTGKKALFVQQTVKDLGLSNVKVESARAEDLLKTLRPAVITGRALAPLNRACSLFAPAIRSGARVLLYKGPNSDAEMEAAAPDALKLGLKLRILDRYELPQALGTRTVVEITR